MAGDTFSTMLEMLLDECDVWTAVVFDELALVSFVDTTAELCAVLSDACWAYGERTYTPNASVPPTTPLTNGLNQPFGFFFRFAAAPLFEVLEKVVVHFCVVSFKSLSFIIFSCMGLRGFYLLLWILT